jgi:hypothetical protein
MSLVRYHLMLMQHHLMPQKKKKKVGQKEKEVMEHLVTNANKAANSVWDAIIEEL